MFTDQKAALTKNYQDGLGITLRILSGFLFALMVVMVKMVSQDVPLGEIVFFRSFFALIPLVIFLFACNEFPTGLCTKRPLGHFFRSIFGVTAMFASFAAIARLPVAEATLISYLSPVLTAITGVIFLGERATVFRAGGIAFGLAGVVILISPELDSPELNVARFTGLLLGVVAAVFTSLALIFTRSLARGGESPGAIAFYFSLTSTLSGFLTLPGGWVIPEPQTLLFLILAGFLGGFAHIAMTLAFKYAEASRLAPFEYTALIWALLADFVIFDLKLSTTFILAAPMVLLGITLASVETRLKPNHSTSE